jgi:hypothetical protein
MSGNTGSPIPRQQLAQTLMTLAGIAYGQPSAIPGYLAADTLTQGQWKIAWIAAQVDPPVNFAYIAKRTDGAYAIAIRGTYPNPLSPAYWDDADLDNPIGPMRTWPGTTDAQVSNGTWTAFQTIIALLDSAGTTTFAEAVASLPDNATIYVTGHSLGGTLTPVIALWLSQMGKGFIIEAMPFAGMTPGNAAFADLFGPGTKLNGRVTRYNNTLDTVPYGWDRVLDTRHFYEPAPQGGLLIEAALGVMALRLLSYGYTAIGAEVQLQGILQPPKIDCGIVAYVLENLHQHLPDTYLDLLGAPKLPFSILFGSVVAPKNSSSYTTGRMPVHFV